MDYSFALWYHRIKGSLKNIEKAEGIAMNIAEDLAYCLCGGSHKCMFQIPSLAVSEYLKVYPAEICTASGGAPNALGFALGIARKLDDIWFTVTPKNIYKFSYRALFIEPLKKGKWPIIGAEAIFKEKAIVDVIDKNIPDFNKILRSRIRIWISVADLISGEILWFSNHDKDMTPEFFRSVTLGTMRIPVFWKPVSCSLKGREYQLADPGLITNIPIRKVVAQGFSKIVIIDTIPREFSPIGKLDTIGETDLRYSEMNHLYEADGHLKWLEHINKNLQVVENIEKLLADPGVPNEIREKIIENNSSYMFYRKRPISVCRINPPANLSIFKKTEWQDYGSPSVAACCELLGAGIVAAQEILLPFLKKHKMVLDNVEFTDSWFDAPRL